jgi:branched-chain amino acid transport system ATP-binding protein
MSNCRILETLDETVKAPGETPDARVQKITAGYGSTTVLRDVSIVVPDATVVALLGPNSAGKSTTLRIASGLLRPDEGVVVLDGVTTSPGSGLTSASRAACVTSRRGAASFPR